MLTLRWGGGVCFKFMKVLIGTALIIFDVKEPQGNCQELWDTRD